MSQDVRTVVEAFAALSAELDDPFAEQEAVFARRGLDDAAHRRLIDAWRARLSEDTAGQLAARFAWAYAEARKEQATRPRGKAPSTSTSTSDPRFLNTDAQAFREEAARVGREPVSDDAPAPMVAPLPIVSPAPAAPVVIDAPPPVEPRRPNLAGTMDISDSIPRDLLPFTAGSAPPAPPPPSPVKAPVPTGTTDISAFVPRHALPFPSSGPPPAPPPPSAVAPAPAPPATPAVHRPPPHLAGTADISAFVPRPATPFAQASPPPPAPPPPGKRLIRFDPQTGLPLPAPIWVDVPTPPERGTK